MKIHYILASRHLIQACPENVKSESKGGILNENNALVLVTIVNNDYRKIKQTTGTRKVMTNEME